MNDFHQFSIDDGLFITLRLSSITAVVPDVHGWTRVYVNSRPDAFYVKGSYEEVVKTILEELK
jgi:hypothetical protein